MNLLGRTIKIVHWILFGQMDSQRRGRLKVVLQSIVKLLEAAKNEAKDIEIVANKKGELTLRFKKEF